MTSGGITEEIIFRWGLLSLTMWAVLWLTPSNEAAFWISIIATGVLFGLAHLPGSRFMVSVGKLRQQLDKKKSI
ncbi:type II CAAX prenyl endopeptidase Rce1 family protein [Paenibacillus sp. PAMC21692]|uniref:CPBP family glutamic-type intramembrane protease n=1 Tax=Paenibacillus sp. PAMC21692 TaxID=2762320 RepID=UPI00164E15BE|nr:CPBP family intramembrane metalloprotease [Paenibacillus sp. PAMC21692]